MSEHESYILLSTAPKAEEEVWIALGILAVIQKNRIEQDRLNSKTADHAEIEDATYVLGQHDMVVRLKGSPDAVFRLAFEIRRVLGRKKLIEDTATMLGTSAPYSAAEVRRCLEGLSTRSGNPALGTLAANVAPDGDPRNKEMLNFADYVGKCAEAQKDGPTLRGMVNALPSEAELAGVAKASKGRATVRLDRDFVELLEGRSYHVFVTPENGRRMDVTTAKDTFEVVCEDRTADAWFSYRVVIDEEPRISAGRS